MKATVIKLNVCIELELKRDTRQTQANNAALNEKVRETLPSEIETNFLYINYINSYLVLFFF